MKSKFFKTYFVAIAVAVFVFVFDMLTKYLLIGSLIPNVGDSASFIEGFINFVHVQNFGASWGIFGGQTWLLIIISIVITAVLLWFYISKLKNSKSEKNGIDILLSVTIGFVVGGCLGNLYDRLVFGYVRDFINFQFMDFPVFNIADSAITIGVVLFIIYFIIGFVKEAKAEKAKKEALKMEVGQTSQVAQEEKGVENSKDEKAGKNNDKNDKNNDKSSKN